MDTTLSPTGGFRNLTEAFAAMAGRKRIAPALSWLTPDGSTTSLTWNGYHDDVATLAAALAAVGVRPGDRVGILSENRPEWLLADLAILAAGAVTVAPHAPLTAPQVRYQLADAEVGWLFVSNAEQLAKIDRVRGELPSLRGVVGFDTPARSDVEPLSAFLRRGRVDAGVLQQVGAQRRPEDLAGILYTSGTTGNPKGVMLTHANILSNSYSMSLLNPADPGDVRLSWLPLTHIYARTVDHYASLICGAHLFLAESSEVVPDLLPRLQPTNMSSVPRLYEKILALCQGDTDEETGQRLRERFGSRRKWFSSGGAPLSPLLAEVFLRAGVLVLQGYGLTESSPVISFNHPGAYRIDTVGQPLPGVEVAIGPDGEVLTRGPHVMLGYWKNDRATAEVIRDGWLHTGDLGEMTDDGFLRITGRKKEMMVLSNGKKIAPPNIEGLLIADPLIEQAVIYGEGRNYLVALIVPRRDLVLTEMMEAGFTLPGSGWHENAALVEFLQRRVDHALRELSPSEQVKKILVLPEPFSVAREELTVSLKLRRGVVHERYRARLEALYVG